jgi:hypothetical protein
MSRIPVATIASGSVAPVSLTARSGAEVIATGAKTTPMADIGTATGGDVLYVLAGYTEQVNASAAARPSR